VRAANRLETPNRRARSDAPYLAAVGEANGIFLGGHTTSVSGCSMALLDAVLRHFLRLVELARFTLGFEFPDDLLEKLHRVETRTAFVALDVQLDVAGGGDGDVEFALWHGGKVWILDAEY
jgi:hypothetical protein